MFRTLMLFLFCLIIARPAQSSEPRYRLADRPIEVKGPDYIVDEETTVEISGEDTTRTMTIVKNRSSQKIAEELHGIKTILGATMAISIMIGVLSFIAVVK